MSAFTELLGEVKASATGKMRMSNVYNAGADANPNDNHDPTTNPDLTLTLSLTLIINLTLTLPIVWLHRSCASMIFTRNSSGYEIANVNFIHDYVIHALQNTIDWCINSATDWCSCVRTQVYQFSEITQCNGNYAIQGHSVSPILVPI